MVGHMANGLPLHQVLEGCDVENGERGRKNEVEAEGDEGDGDAEDKLGHTEVRFILDEMVGKNGYVRKDLALGVQKDFALDV
jgi:hypothetical protein